MPRIDDLSNLATLVESLLAADPVATLKLKGMILNHNVKEAIVDSLEAPTAVLLSEGRFNAFFAVDLDGAETVLDELDWSEPQAFSGLWEPLSQIVTERAKVVWDNPCHQYHLPDTEHGSETLFELRGDDAHLMQPHEEHAALILANWPYGDPEDPDDRSHIAARVESGMSSGWVEDHRLVCWAMSHDDGSLGYLHTLEGYRGRGIARRVAADLTLKVWNQGQTPFCHVVASNNGPVRLLEELGFVRSDDRFLWLGCAPA